MSKRRIEDFKKDFDKQMKEINSFMKDELPELAAEELQDIVDNSFEKEAYQGDKKPSKWAGRKKDPEAGNQRTSRRGVLVDSAELIKSTEVSVKGNTVSASTDRQTSKGKWNLGKIHNEGLTPQKQRQFMPIPGEESPELTERIEKHVDRKFDEQFK
jgi:hypothetical protein